MASLVANLDKDDFTALEVLWLNRHNLLTDAACASVASAIDGTGMPILSMLVLHPVRKPAPRFRSLVSMPHMTLLMTLSRATRPTPAAARREDILDNALFIH